MTREELIDKLKELKRKYDRDGDGERWSCLAEEYLLEYINDPEIDILYTAIPTY
jgi:hypothetical protein